ncbi:MAG TPA: GNAT family N-acetyltransferase [Actinopolymorphaceae bacterium]|jgi:GNAT superfamily N-acetyltransferase
MADGPDVPVVPPAVIRPAVVADADALGDLHVLAWQRAFGDIFAPADLAALDPVERAEGWRFRLGAMTEQPPGEPATYCLVAQESPVAQRDAATVMPSGRLLGFASFGPSRDEPASPDVGEVYALYAHPDHLGHGVGAALMGAALATLAAEGYDEATLWTPAANTRGRAFYDRGGWTLDGAVKPFVLGTREVLEVRYRLALARP